MCRRRATTSGGTARPSTRDLSDAHLIQQLRAIHAESRQTYGVRRCRAELRLGDRRLAVPHKRVARLMRIAGLQGVHRRRWRHSQPAAAVWETECSAASTPTGPTSCGAPTSPSTARARAGSTPRSCSTCSPAGSSAGQSRTTCAPSWSSMRCTWPSGAVDRPALSSTPIFEWIEAFYNPTRRHSALVYLTPIDYQTLHTAAPAAA
jgi:putative transposase